MSDYTDNIKRIVGIDELKNKLKDLEEKAAIYGRRGIAYETAEGIGNVSSSGGDLVNIGGNAAASAATKAALQALAEGKTVEKSNTATGDDSNAALAGKSLQSGLFKSDSDGVFDAEDYFDNAGAGGLGSNIGEVLSGLTGFRNLSDTKDVSVRFDGLFVPPADFTSIDGLYVYDDLWQLGYQWSGLSGLTFWPNPAQALNDIFDNTPNLVADYNKGTIESDGGTGYIMNISLKTGGGDTFFGTSRTPCTPGSSVNCPLTAPVTYFFPLRDDVQLAQDKYVAQSLIPSATGFSAHPRDAINTPLDLAGEQSTIELTFAGGTRNALIEPNNIGGSIISEIDPITKAYIGTSRIYDGSGMLAAYATDSTQLDSYRP